ncbi:MAG: hypothetical protein IT201_04815 [Thermoleophilia bacterium]|nr:hypothetical protein [Thermoleophilia bacterium]
MRGRLPLVLSLVALMVAILGWTPVGEAAEGWVKRAPYANNAGKVNGIKASKTPMPGRLLALDPAGQFPASVLPQPPQPPTTDAFSVYRNGAVPIAAAWTTVAQLPLPDAGAYVVIAKAEVSNSHATARGAADCALQAGVDSDRGLVVLEPGSARTDVATITLTVVHQTGGLDTAVLSCNDFVGGAVTASNTKVTAIRVDNLTNAPG